MLIEHVMQAPGSLGAPGPGPVLARSLTFGEVVLLLTFSAIVIGCALYVIRRVLLEVHALPPVDRRASILRSIKLSAPAGPPPVTTVVTPPVTQKRLLTGMMLEAYGAADPDRTEVDTVFEPPPKDKLDKP